MPLSGMTKRKPEVINLSAGDNQQPRKIPRLTNARGDPTKPQLSGPQYTSLSQSYPSSTNYDASQYTDATALYQSNALRGSSYSQKDLWLNKTNKLNADKVIIITQNANSNSGETFELYSTILNKIVDIHYHNGYATNKKHMIIQKNPNNQYNSNAIQVNNLQKKQIGHLPHTVISKLTPYINHGNLVISNILIKERGKFNYPITVHLYNISEPIDQLKLKNQIRSDKLPLDALTKKKKEAKTQNTEAIKQAAMKKKLSTAASNKHRFTNNQLNGAPSPVPINTNPSLRSIILKSQRTNPREVSEIIGKFNIKEEALSLMPTTDTPSTLRTELLPY